MHKQQSAGDLHSIIHLVERAKKRFFYSTALVGIVNMTFIFLLHIKNVLFSPIL